MAVVAPKAGILQRGMVIKTQSFTAIKNDVSCVQVYPRQLMIGDSKHLAWSELLCFMACVSRCSRCASQRRAVCVCVCVLAEPTVGAVWVAESLPMAMLSNAFQYNTNESNIVITES